MACFDRRDSSSANLSAVHSSFIVTVILWKMIFSFQCSIVNCLVNSKLSTTSVQSSIFQIFHHVFYAVCIVRRKTVFGSHASSSAYPIHNTRLILQSLIKPGEISQHYSYILGTMHPISTIYRYNPCEMNEDDSDKIVPSSILLPYSPRGKYHKYRALILRRY